MMAQIRIGVSAVGFSLDTAIWGLAKLKRSEYFAQAKGILLCERA
jgi:hypothetical protein